jgi:hypothetical protein
LKVTFIMSASQLDLLPPDQAAILLRKRRFWKRTLSISLPIGVILSLFAVSGTVISMIRAFSTLEKDGVADPSALAGEISMAMLIGMYSALPACLALLIAMVSFIRLLSLPRIPKG